MLFKGLFSLLPFPLGNRHRKSGLEPENQRPTSLSTYEGLWGQSKVSCALTP